MERSDWCGVGWDHAGRGRCYELLQQFSSNWTAGLTRPGREADNIEEKI